MFDGQSPEQWDGSCPVRSAKPVEGPVGLRGHFSAGRFSLGVSLASGNGLLDQCQGPATTAADLGYSSVSIHNKALRVIDGEDFHD